MKSVIPAVAALVLLSTFATTSPVAAQGRGRGRNSSNWGRKCEKFINCHDARDGRWDNRGPRRRGSLIDRYYSPYYRSRADSVYRSRRIYRGDRLDLRDYRRW